MLKIPKDIEKAGSKNSSEPRTVAPTISNPLAYSRTTSVSESTDDGLPPIEETASEHKSKHVRQLYHPKKKKSRRKKPELDLKSLRTTHIQRAYNPIPPVPPREPPPPPPPPVPPRSTRPPQMAPPRPPPRRSFGSSTSPSSGPPPPPPPKRCSYTQQETETLRKLRMAEAEVERLKMEQWKESERKKILEEKQKNDAMELLYYSQLRQWEANQTECEKDRKRRKAILRYIAEKRREKKLTKIDERKWRHFHNKMSRDESERLAQEYEENEESRFMELMRIHTDQEDKLLEVQATPRNTENMKAPELEELRRMFAPVARGPNEMFEYYVLEPQPTTEELRRKAEHNMAAMLGLRNAHGIHLNLSDRCKKRTTIQLAMGPKFQSGERDQFCNVITEPGAFW